MKWPTDVLGFVVVVVGKLARPDVDGEDRFPDFLIGRDGCGQLRGGRSRLGAVGIAAGAAGGGL